MSYSVALCTFNGEDYIQDQLNSIVWQSIPPKQIVICDDASDDKTNEIVKEVIRKAPHILWKHKVNETTLGVTMNFEQATNMCDEEIVFFSDQDDVWVENKAEIVLSFFNRNNFSVVFSDASIVDEELIPMASTMFKRLNFDLPSQKAFKYKKNAMFALFMKCHATGATMAFKKSFVIQLMPFNKSTLFIHDSWVSTLAACAEQLSFIDKPLVLYRQHKNQMIGAGFIVSPKMEKRKFFKKKDLLKKILKEKFEKECVVLSFFEKNQHLISKENFQILKKRNQLYEKLLNPKKNIFRRIFAIKISLYRYRVPEFNTLRLFMGNSLIFILQ